MSRDTVRLGTRGSRLSLAQAALVEASLRARVPALRVETVIVHTAGDRTPDVPLDRLQGIGFFAKELEHALLEGRCDLAVHSAKDMPTAIHRDLCLAAILPRDEPRDVLVSRDGSPLFALPSGARVGTGSLRRSAQLRHIRPDIVPVPIRGNIDTRLAKLDRGDVDALCLAGVGLLRMGWADRISQWLDPEVMLPAPAQGALAVEVRKADRWVLDLVRPLDDLPTREAVSAERAVVARLGSGCRAPAAALATVRGGRIHLEALVASEDGSRVRRHRAEGPVGSGAWLGMAVADWLATHAGDLLRGWPSRRPEKAPAGLSQAG